MFKSRPGLTAGCLLFSLNAFSLNVNAQVTCSSASSDSDGDGWGWENNATCIVSSDPSATTSDATPTAIDTPSNRQPVTAPSAVIALEDGTPLAALSFSNAHLSDGYAIVTPPDASATGVIYSRSGDSRWTEQASVSVPDFEITDQLEESRGVFAISDNYAVVGLPGYYPSNAGSAHIFARVDDNQWSLETVLDGASRPFDFFGKSVSISGDTLAVGSNPGGEASQNGRVSIYSRGVDGWMLDQSIDSNFENPDAFGNTVLLSESLLVIPHLRDGGRADVYQRGANGWQMHSDIRGEVFALHQNTIVAAAPGLLRTYILDASNSFQVSNPIEYPNRSVTSLALSEQHLAEQRLAEQHLVVTFSNESSVHHYLKTADNSWQFAGEIDGLPSTPVPSDRVFLTVNGISDQSVIISRSAFPENIEPIFDIHIVDLPDNESSRMISNTTDSAPNMDTIGQVDETVASDNNIVVSENTGIDQNTQTDEQSVLTECIDTDGDGYGWNGIETCLPNGLIPTDTTSAIGIGNSVGDQSPTACIDTDGDGFGWNGFQTCLPTAPANNAGNEIANTVCFDSDGDSYGWTGTQTCRFNQDGSITLF